MSDFVVLEFKTEYKNGKETDWVLIAPPGEAFERVHTWHRIKDLIPPTDPDDNRRNSEGYQVMQARWSIIGPKYEAWKRNEALPETGTPLGAWAGVSTEQAQVLKRMGITTVEGVRDMSESAIVKLPFPNARKLPQLAGQFLASQGDAEKDRQIAEMQERMAIMEEMLAATMPEKRGPGRPKKQEEAA
jgi:hypothetical protein